MQHGYVYAVRETQIQTAYVLRLAFYGIRVSASMRALLILIVFLSESFTSLQTMALMNLKRHILPESVTHLRCQWQESS